MDAPRVSAAALATLGLMSCATSSGPAPTFNIGGTVVGLEGSGFVLRESVSGVHVGIASGSTTFSLATGVAIGTAYNVSVLTQPSTPPQTCVVTGGSGTVTNANVSLSITCTVNSYVVGGHVRGLEGSGLVLQNNGGDNLPVSANGPYEFATRVPSGGHYAITVLAQPTLPSQTCVVTDDPGTVTNADISIWIACTTNVFAIGGTVSNLTGIGLVLQNNGADNVTVMPGADASFLFQTMVPSGGAYAVTVLTQPTTPQQKCTVSGGSGTVTDGPVSLSISCITYYTVGGTITGLKGTGLKLQNNGGDSLDITVNGHFTFGGLLLMDQPYLVSVASQPVFPTQLCTVTGGSGNIADTNVTDVAIACSN